MERKESHTLWNALMEHMNGDHCPVCSLIKERNHSAMDNFLYECANLPDIRLKIKQEGGFCQRHSKELRLFGDPLAHAIIYQDLFEVALENLDSKPKKAFFGGKVGGGQSSCFFCRKEQTSEEHFTKGMADAASNQEFLEKYEKEGMLCIPHLKAVLQIRAKDRNAVLKMKQSTLNKYDKMLGSLKEIMRKHDFHYTNEPLTDQEREDWQRAVTVFQGLEKEQDIKKD